MRLAYPAIRSMGQDTKFTVVFFHSFTFSLCTVTDFSAGALPIGVKFCTAVRPHLRQVFSHFGGYSPRDGGVMGVKSTCIDVVQDVLMVHGLLVSAERSDQSVAC